MKVETTLTDKDIHKAVRTKQLQSIDPLSSFQLHLSSIAATMTHVLSIADQFVCGLYR
jgi:hypothetical protein